MFSTDMQAWGRRIADMIVGPLARTSITPNMLTVVGLMLSALTALILAQGWFLVGGLLLLVSGVFDMFDGALARVQNSRSTFGAFFDSTLDRLAEAGVGLGVAWYYLAQIAVVPPAQRTGFEVNAMLVFVMIVGSLMISYTRARAEGLGLECKIGLVARPERVVILALGLLFGHTTTVLALVLLAVSTLGTTLQRIYHVWATIQRQEALAQSAAESNPAARGVDSLRRKRALS